MQTLSFLVAFAVFLVAPSLAGMPDSALPGSGAFSYCGSPIVTDAPPMPIVVASR